MTPRLLFLGTEARFSQVALEGLLARGVALVGVVVAGAPPGLHPLAGDLGDPELRVLRSAAHEGLAAVAARAALPAWQLGEATDPALTELRSIAPDVILVACWPRRLPAAVLEIPRRGAYNLHPSLLPDYRGPAPIFWQRRAGERRGGLTLHRMIEAIDAGPIVSQVVIPWPEGATGPELDTLAARWGASLAVGALERIAAGTLQTREQSPGGSSQGWPEDDDFAIPTDWSARRAWNFIRATEEWGRPYRILSEDGEIEVTHALEFHPSARLARAVIHDAERVVVRFSPGIVLFPRPPSTGIITG